MNDSIMKTAPGFKVSMFQGFKPVSPTIFNFETLKL